MSDRYTITGAEPSACDCEGLGVIPVFMNKGVKKENYLVTEDEVDCELIKLWDKAEEKNPTDNGYHFVFCSKCNEHRG